MAVARSAEFEEFLASVNAPLRFTRDNLDEIPNIGTFHSLVGAERVEAEDILIAKLADNDGRVAAFLAEAYCERAIPALVVATTEAAAPVMRVFAARALLTMGNQAGRDGLVRMLRAHDGSGFDRGSAIHAEWTAGAPVTGPLAVGTDGEIIVPVSGELVGLGYER